MPCWQMTGRFCVLTSAEVVRDRNSIYDASKDKPTVLLLRPSWSQYAVQRRNLGESGIEVSVIGLGTWAMGGAAESWGPVDDRESIAAIHQALKKQPVALRLDNVEVVCEAVIRLL